MMRYVKVTTRGEAVETYEDADVLIDRGILTVTDHKLDKTVEYSGNYWNKVEWKQ